MFFDSFTLTAKAEPKTPDVPEPKRLANDVIIKSLPGTWVVEEVFAKGNKTTVRTTYAKEGGFQRSVETDLSGKPQKFSYSGTWQVQDGVVTETVTQGEGRIKAGQTFKIEVTQIDDKTMKYVDGTKREKTAKRAME
jgi:hypothetical protein